MLFHYTIFCLLIRVKPNEVKRLVNGLHRPSILEIPHHVVVAYRNLYCSGSLLKSKVVITTASCLKARNKDKVVVKVGADSLTGFGQVIEVEHIKSHEYFAHSSELDNDIALLYLKDHVIFGPNVKKTIITDDAFPLEGTKLEVSGWENMEHSAKYANSLLWSEMMLVSTSECKKLFPYLVTRSNFCGVYLSECCITDNGGPATQDGWLYGILSYSNCAAEPNLVALFTNVTYFHRWITMNTKRLMASDCRLQNHHFDFDVKFD